MLLGSKKHLVEILVQTLADMPSGTARQLQTHIAKNERFYTIQAIYQELRNLEADGVVIKVGENFRLKTSWVLELTDLVDRMYDTHHEDTMHSGIIPEQGKKRTWHFPDIHRLDNFIISISIPLAREAADKSVFLWAPRCFWHLAHHESERQFVNSLKIAGIKYYVIFGTDEFLNRLYVEYLQTPNCFYSFAKSPFHGKIEHYFILTGDYVVTASLDRETKARLDCLFEKVKGYSDISVGEVAEVFSQRGKMTCSIEHKPNKAKRFQKKFYDYFGL